MRHVLPHGRALPAHIQNKRREGKAPHSDAENSQENELEWNHFLVDFRRTEKLSLSETPSALKWQVGVRFQSPHRHSLHKWKEI